jgi:hypothetical protein
MTFYVGIGGEWKWVDSNSSVSTGWYHWAGVYDGNNLKIYLDGVLDGVAPVSGVISSTGDGDPNWLTIGKDYHPSLRPDEGYNKGLIDEAAVYNRALTADEIQQHYQNGLEGLGYEVIDVGTSPRISLNRSVLNFGSVNSQTTSSQEILVTNSGNGTLNWSVTDDKNWLSGTPASGTGPGTVTVSVDSTGLSIGTYIGIITISDPNASNSPQTVTVTLEVYSSGSTSSPFGSFETPVHGSTVQSSVPVTGWVLDDIGVESVKIYRANGKNLVYIGDGLFVEGARPDIQQAFPGYPMNYQAGWGYMMLSNFLPNGGNGTFTFHAIAADIEGNQVTLGTKTITVDNANAVKPFGAIDTPAQGGTASGSNFRNQGWVLTPMPNAMPTDGSIINVYVNGVNLGHAAYNIYRPDIATLFPGYANSDGALAYFDFDTTSYNNGVHTIAWTAADDAGNTDGIGSRYFTVQNGSAGRREQGANLHGAWSMEHGGGLHGTANVSTEPVEIVKGYKRDMEAQTIYPDDNGNITIEINELERLEIHLDNSRHSSFIIHEYTESFCSGYLPIGSTLDMEKGIFYWQPGPGFVGFYRFVFIKEERNSELKKKIITVKIVPKF